MMENLTEARPLLEKALNLSTELHGTDTTKRALILVELGSLHLKANEDEQAVKSFSEALQILRRHLPPDDEDVTFAINELARSYSNVYRFKEAADLNAENLKVREASLGKKHPATLLSLHNLSVNYHDLARYAESVELLEKWFETDADAPKKSYYVRTFEHLGDGHKELHHWEKADTWFNRGLALMQVQKQRDYKAELRVLEKLLSVCDSAAAKDKVLKYGELCLALCKSHSEIDQTSSIAAMLLVGCAYCDVRLDAQAATILREAMLQSKKAKLPETGLYWSGMIRLGRKSICVWINLKKPSRWLCRYLLRLNTN